MVKILNRTRMPTRGIVLSYFGWLRNARLVQVHSSTLLTSVRTKTTMACRRILLQLPRNATVWSRSASGQTTGVDYLKPEDNTQVKTHTGQVHILFFLITKQLWHISYWRAIAHLLIWTLSFRCSRTTGTPALRTQHAMWTRTMPLTWSLRCPRRSVLNEWSFATVAVVHWVIRKSTLIWFVLAVLVWPSTDQSFSSRTNPVLIRVDIVDCNSWRRTTIIEGFFVSVRIRFL